MIGKSDIPFDRDETGRYLPWIIATMVGLSALLLALGTALGDAMLRDAGQYESSFSVQIPGDLEKIDEITKSAQSLLESTEGVAAVALLDDAALRKQIEPWLGRNNMSEFLPVPRVLEAKLASENPPDFAALSEKLKALSPEIELDTHQQWVAKFSHFLSQMRQLTLMLTAALLTVMTLAIVLAVKNGLRIHHKTVAILHSIGAEDSYIARQFQRHALKMSLKGGLIGIGVAAVLYALIGTLAQDFSATLLPDLRLSVLHILLFLFLLAATGAIAHVVSRWTVLGMLRKIN